MRIMGNGKNTDQNCGLAENEPGITTVRCPHLKSCQFGAMKAKQARGRCRGMLCRINHWEACMVISYKCERLRKRILVEIKGNAIRHIPRNSSEHQELLPRLRKLFCEACKCRVLDYHVIYGDAIVDVKCSHDGQFSSHTIK